MRSPPCWLVSRGFDLAWILAPGLLPLMAVFLIPSFHAGGADLSVLGFLLLVVGVDVAHVYATLYRTYLDPEEFARRRFAYLLTPFACLLIGVLLHRAEPILFWRALAYLAVLHFVRQQFGLVRLYAHRMGEDSRLDALLDRAAIYAATLYPVLWWHLHPRAFAWFVPGDFRAFSAPVLVPVAKGVWAGILALFASRQAWRYLREGVWNPGKTGVVATTAISWYGGIVYFNSDIAFTATNVVAHGVPYIALVWLYCSRKWTAREGNASWMSWISAGKRILAFYGVLFVLAYVEEGAWDVLVWRDHASLFGAWQGIWRPSSERLLSVLVPLLALPQATHYVLDAMIWRFDERSNPGLRGYVLK